jgi:flagellar motility protein MotE (MotC chaperone)
MKKMLIIIPFVFAFIFVTGALVYLNSIYTNIFQFDFTPRASQSQALLDSLAIKDSLNALNQESLIAAQDTVKDTTNTALLKNESENLSSNANMNIDVAARVDNLTKDKFNDKAKNDSAYAAWLKKTVKLVENLSPAQASKLLKNFSDNQARDIIYAMKQKQAAKIISYLEPEYVYKLTRFQ